MIRKRYRLWRIKRALHIQTIYPEVRAYVLRGDPSVLSGPRQNGKTTAVLLRALINKDFPPDCYRWNNFHVSPWIEDLKKIFSDDPDLSAYPSGVPVWLFDFYARETLRAIDLCRINNISVVARRKT